MLRHAARKITRATALAALVALVATGCSNDITAPTAEITDTVAELDAPSVSGFELPVDDAPQKPSARPSLSQTKFRIVNYPGALEPTYAHFGAKGRIVATFASYDEAVEALQNLPRQHGRHVGVGIDFGQSAQLVTVLDALIQRHEESLLQFEIQDLMSRYQNDRASLSRKERVYMERFLLPNIAVMDDLHLVRAEATATPELGRFWTKVLKAFYDALTGEDYRQGDHDGDGIINSQDDDYDGTVWSAGEIKVVGGGSTSRVELNYCVDPCMMFGIC